MRDKQLQYVLMKQGSKVSVTSMPQSLLFRAVLSAHCGAPLTEPMI